MSKRAVENEDASSSGQPPMKKVQFEPIRIGPISTLEEMDIKVLQFQNKKLAQRLEQKNRVETDLRSRIEQLEKRQTQDDAVLNVVNRYWNQLNEDIRILLQRFDAETADESESKNESDATTSFLMQLSTWDKEELDEKLANRVQVSKRAVAKIIQAFDRLVQRNEKITMILKGEVDNSNGEPIPTLDEAVRDANIQIQAENKTLTEQNTKLHAQHHSISLKISELQDAVNGKETEGAELRNQIDDLQYELSKVQARNDKLETHLCEAMEKVKMCAQIHRPADDKDSSTGGVVKPVSTLSNVSQSKLEDLQKDLEEAKELANNRLQELDKLHLQHREVLKDVEKLKMDIRQLPESVIVETTEYKCLQSAYSVLYNENQMAKTQAQEFQAQLSASKNNQQRQIEMMETEELMVQKKLRGELMQLEDALSQLRKEYEMLRIEFETNLAANEQTGPINREMRHLITSLQNHNQQLKGEVTRYKRKYRESTVDIQKLKKDVEDLRSMKHHHSHHHHGNNAGASSSHHNPSTSGSSAGPDKGGVKEELCQGGVKEEPGVLKDNVKEEAGGVTLSGVKKEDTTEAEDASFSVPSTSSGTTGSQPPLPSNPGDSKDRTGDSGLVSPAVKKEPGSGAPGNVPPKQGGLPVNPALPIKKEGVPPPPMSPHHKMPPGTGRDVKMMESDLVRDLKSQIKKALNDMKELKLLLDMYKSLNKDQRDKVGLMAAEKKLRAEVEDLKLQLKKVQDSKRDERKKLADEEAMRKIKQLEEQTHQLQKQVATHKQEEEALLNEMEVTGQAFEDMQEQNSRLLQQLREKDDANFKLMTERIKSNQLHKLAREEKDTLREQVQALSLQIEAMHTAIRKLEEKERFLQTVLTNAEKELHLRNQAMDLNKRKAIESAQSAADLKLHLEKYHAQMKEAQQVVAEKTSSLEAEAYKTKRLQEEIAQLRRKTERMKKIEQAGTLDEVMLEEIREYKETLTCPSCKVKRKDAVLTKCFHVFCWDCLRTRYETRQRKCPKCNAAFGANDYHRLYLGS
uniref:E3 ubiquitin protein ligase n=1 Tax=Cacopsylla melanoneura TaxID=428564 RepID=A0A8D8LKE6_9HEMI